MKRLVVLLWVITMIMSQHLLMAHQQMTQSIGQYSASMSAAKTWEVIDLTMTATNTYSRDKWPVSISYTGTSGTPSGKGITLKGFWGGDKTWKVRFAFPNFCTWINRNSPSYHGLNITNDDEGFKNLNPFVAYVSNQARELFFTLFKSNPTTSNFCANFDKNSYRYFFPGCCAYNVSSLNGQHLSGIPLLVISPFITGVVRFESGEFVRVRERGALSPADWQQPGTLLSGKRFS